MSSVIQWWITGIVIFALLAALVAVAYRTRVGVISRAATKEAIRQPVFLLMLGGGALAAAGSSLIFDELWVHGAVFGRTRPAATMVVVKELLDPRWKVEIEAEAVLD